MGVIGLLFLFHYLSAGQLTQCKPHPDILQAGAVSTRFFFTLYCFKKKKKENEARPGCSPPGKKTTA